MRYFFFIIFSTFLFTGCASNNPITIPNIATAIVTGGSTIGEKSLSQIRYNQVLSFPKGETINIYKWLEATINQYSSDTNCKQLVQPKFTKLAMVKTNSDQRQNNQKVKNASRKENSKNPENSQDKTQSIASPDFSHLMICFENLKADQKIKLRNIFVQQTILLSDSHCHHRMQTVQTGVQSADTTTGILENVANFIGVATQDGLTSRIASAASGASGSLVNTVKDNFLSGGDVIKIVDTINRARTSNKNEIYRKIKDFSANHNYDSWILVSAMNDMFEYDLTCDIFN